MNYRFHTLKLSMIITALMSTFTVPAVTEDAVNIGFTVAALTGSVISGGLCWTALKDQKDVRGIMTPLAALMSYSVIKGLQNMRKDQNVISNIEKTYGLIQQYGLFEIPGVAFRDTVCLPVEDTSVAKLDPFMVTVKDKVRALKELHPLALWDFGLFTHFMPHTDIQGTYGVSVNYFQPFHAPYMKKLKESVNFHIQMIEADFNALKQISSLWSFASYVEYGVKIPKTQNALIDLTNQLNQCYQRKIISTCGGIFGYSALHNSDRVKTAMLVLAEYHMYLLQLREFLSTCAQDDLVDLQNTSGYLSFMVQHTHFIKENK